MPIRAESARAIEAILMVAQEPVETHLLAQLLEVAPAIVDELCDQLAARYRDDDRGFELVRVAGGYRFQSRDDLAPYVERFVLEGQSARLSAAALETLAIVAYKQPISRAQIAAIRGVNVDGVMRTLVQRGYLEEVGRDPGPGQAVLFGTSREFLERLGLDSLEDLPPIADLFPNAEVMEALERGLRTEPDETAPSRGPERAGAEVPVDEDRPESAPSRPDERRPSEEPVDPPSTPGDEVEPIDLDAPVADIPVPAWALDDDETGDGPGAADGAEGSERSPESER